MSISSFIKKVFNVGINLGIGLALILFVPGIPPKFQFKAYTISPPMKLEGKLAANSILDKAVHFAERDLVRPESLAIRGDDIYTGEFGGDIITIDKNGKISLIGHYDFPCNPTSTERCSFPLGMKFDNEGRLVYADHNGGLLRLDVTTGKQEILVPKWELIEGQYPIIPEDLDIAKDGTIYWTDGTVNEQELPNVLTQVLLSERDGRLLKYDPKLKKTEVLLNNLHFSNGMALSKNEDFILIAESNTCRIVKYHLKGANKGKTEIFLDGLPGYPDNIRRNEKGDFYITLFALRNKEFEFQTFPTRPLIRKMLARLMWISQTFLKGIETYALPQNEFLLSLYDYIGHWGPLLDWQKSPKRGLVIEVDERGEILRSFHSTRDVWGISQFTIGKEYAYINSPINPKLWRIKLTDLGK